MKCISIRFKFFVHHRFIDILRDHDKYCFKQSNCISILFKVFLHNILSHLDNFIYTFTIIVFFYNHQNRIELCTSNSHCKLTATI